MMLCVVVWRLGRHATTGTKQGEEYDGKQPVHCQSKAKESGGLSPNTVNVHSHRNAEEMVHRINVGDYHIQLVEARPNQPAESHFCYLVPDAHLHRLL